MRYIFSLRYLLVLFALLCTACGTALPTVKPYKLDVQQGNVVTSKMLLQLRPGMTKSQVRFIMGTPLIQDSFHGNRWDYVYQLREKGKIVEQRRVILDFENELLKTVRGDVIPAGSGTAADETSNTGTRTVQPVDKTKEKGLMDKLKFWKKDEVPPAPVTPVAPQAKPESDGPQPVAPELITPEPAAASPAESSASDAPADAPKSILSVPMETPAASPEPAPTEALSPPVAEPARVEPAADPSPAASPSQPPAESVTEPYEPSSGMQFDKDLKIQSDQTRPVEVTPRKSAPAASAPPARAGNQSAPAPKDLPPESDPDFFERMLEKIGF